LRFPPPYSTDFNPIEQAFAKLEDRVRETGELTVEGLPHLLGRLVGEFTPRERRSFLSGCGCRAISMKTG
jgi:transposase